MYNDVKTFWSQDYDQVILPHHLKSEASGKPVVMLPLILFSDDTSGNKSKQWNKFDSWCLRIAGLPIKENSKLHNIHLICCSNKCSVKDMAEPVVVDLLTLENKGITVFDAALKCEVLLVAPVMGILADNPRHSEIMSHSGPSAKKYCRICMVCVIQYMCVSCFECYHCDACSHV